jgi:hypothetical protein
MQRVLTENLSKAKLMSDCLWLEPWHFAGLIGRERATDLAVGSRIAGSPISLKFRPPMSDSRD